jgi:hypothetical protein
MQRSGLVGFTANLSPSCGVGQCARKHRLYSQSVDPNPRGEIIATVLLPIRTTGLLLLALGNYPQVFGFAVHTGVEVAFGLFGGPPGLECVTLDLLPGLLLGLRDDSQPPCLMLGRDPLVPSFTLLRCQ